jgi:hypothetical protein
MTLIEINVKEFESFIGYYGMIMFKEYKRWILRNKLPPGYKAFVKFKFHSEENRRLLRRREQKYEFKHVREFKKVSTVESTSNFPGIKKKKMLNAKNNKVEYKLDPDIRNKAREDNAKIVTKYITYDDVKCDELSEIKIINETFVSDLAYDEISSFELRVLEYDFLNPIDVGCQTMEIGTLEFSTQTEANMMCVGDNFDQPINKDEYKQVESSVEKKVKEVKVDIYGNTSLSSAISGVLTEPEEPEQFSTLEELNEYRESLEMYKRISSIAMGKNYSSAEEDEFNSDDDNN